MSSGLIDAIFTSVGMPLGECRFIVGPFPMISPDKFEKVRFGTKTAAEVVREVVLELTYTAHDMAPFARDMGYVE